MNDTTTLADARRWRRRLKTLLEVCIGCVCIAPLAHLALTIDQLPLA